LPVQAATVRARCERTAVEPCQMTYDEMAEYGSVMQILLVCVRWGRAIGWVCKPEVTGSIPVRSIFFGRYANRAGQKVASRNPPGA
jgi:hypothetical protein